MSPSNPVAMVTGSGKKRVGYHVARRLAERGYSLAIHYNSSADEARETVAELGSAGSRAVALGADLGDESAVKRLVADALAEFGRIDVLVNSAAVFEGKPLEETTADDVRFHFEANTLGTFLTCQHVGLHMVSQEQGGCIVNVGDWAHARPYEGYAAYFASKGAIPTLTRCFAVELARRNPKVRVNCVHPGPVLFPEGMPKAERDAVIEATLVKHEGSPDDVARAVMMFVENTFVTGAEVNVDGGRAIS